MPVGRRNAPFELTLKIISAGAREDALFLAKTLRTYAAGNSAGE
jgi:hypothetical protein